MKEIGFLFDLDGVLVDSEKEYTRIWDEIEKRYPTGIDNFALSIKGQTLGKILNDHYSLKDREKVSELLHELEKMMRYEYCQYAEEFLDQIKKKNIKIAVVTSSDEIKMEHLYKDLPEFRNKVNVIIDSTKVERSKPDPEGYLKAAKELGVNIQNCTVFEDSVQGVKAGHASGALVVGVIGTKTREELLPYSDILINGFKEIDLEDLVEITGNR